MYHWLRDKTKVGYALRVVGDHMNRIKYSVSNSLGGSAVDLETALTTGTATMILPDCGVEMHKSFRLPIPEHVLRLQQMWSTALSVSLGDICIFCNGGSYPELVTVCPLCNTSMHLACASRVSIELFPGKLFEAHQKHPCADGTIPAWWMGRICNLCRATMM